MKYTRSTALALLFSTAFAAPPRAGSFFKRADSGSYTVPGLGARKEEITGAGGETVDMAIAMLETEDMSTDYEYGDGKTEDAANFGIFKQNWGMLTECSSQFQGKSTADWNDGAVLNDDLDADIAARQECESFYGQDTWFAGHRNGEAGLENPDTDDIQLYKTAISWIQEQLEGNSSLTDDTRYWYDVPPI